MTGFSQLLIRLLLLLNWGVQATSFIQNWMSPSLAAARQTSAFGQASLSPDAISAAYAAANPMQLLSAAPVPPQTEPQASFIQNSMPQASLSTRQQFAGQALPGSDSFGTIAALPSFSQSPPAQAQFSTGFLPPLSASDLQVGLQSALPDALTSFSAFPQAMQPIVQAPTPLQGQILLQQPQPVLGLLSLQQQAVEEEKVRHSAVQTQQLQQQLQAVQQQLRQTQSVEGGLVEQKQRAETIAFAAQAETGRTIQRAQQLEYQLQSEVNQVKAAQAELARKTADASAVQAQLRQTEDIAEKALAAQKVLDKRVHDAEAKEAEATQKSADLERRAVQELRRARAEIQQSQMQIQQAQADAVEARAAQAASEEQLARAAVVQATQQDQMAQDVRSAQSNVAQAEQLMQGFATMPQQQPTDAISLAAFPSIGAGILPGLGQAKAT